MNISELKAKEKKELTLLVKSVDDATASNGASYQRIRVRDESGSETIAMHFNAPLRLQAGKVYKMLIEAAPYNTGMSYLAHQAEVATDINVSMFAPKAQINVTHAWNEIVKTTNSLRFTIKKVIAGILTEHQHEFCTLPLTGDTSFAREAGILEATLKLLNVSRQLAEEMNVDKDMLLGGAILYYIGAFKCVDELYNSLPAEALIGSGTLASDMILIQAEKVRDSFQLTDSGDAEELDDEDVTLLRHIVMSRFSGVDPATTEATILRYADGMIRMAENMNTFVTGLEAGELRKTGKKYGYKRK